MRDGVQINAVRPASEDNADWCHGSQLFQGGCIRFYLAINAAFPNPACNELVVLSAKVQDEDKLVFHRDHPFSCVK